MNQNGASPAARPHRRLFHLAAASFFPSLLLFFPRWNVFWAALALFAIVMAGEVLRSRSVNFNRFLMSRLYLLTKEKERRTPFGSTYVVAATVVAIAAFPQPVAALALFYLAIGDPVAALVGERMGAHRLLDRSWEGSLAFLAGALVIGATLLSFDVETTAPVMVVGAVAATVFEVAPLWLDDNLKVPLGAGAVMAVMHHWWG